MTDNIAYAQMESYVLRVSGEDTGKLNEMLKDGWRLVEMSACSRSAPAPHFGDTYLYVYLQRVITTGDRVVLSKKD